ncbi:MAG: RNA-binding S4 domain-containing protein [Fidelibacterota bacterium]|nr:MAG: RNA-binding S4 domain-containing protein [Candidatus Neomarinimicrobiota bacterium]
MDELRIDRWLWVTRLFKTRRLAAEACQAGKVKLDGRSVKPSRTVKVGDGLQITRKHYRQRISVTGLSERRVSPHIAATLYEDTTPNEELEQARLVQTMEGAFHRERRKAGRPTKRDRRVLQKLKGQL